MNEYTLEKSTKTMSPDEAIKALEALEPNSDYESAHLDADEILCALLRHLGHQDVVDAWDKIGKWYA